MIYNDERPERIRGIVYLLSLLMFGLYQGVNIFVPNADAIVGLRILASAVYSAVLTKYWKVAFRAFAAPDPSKEDFLLAGIWLSFLAHNLQTIYSVLYRLANAPPWLLNAEVVPFIVIISMIAGALHVVAPGAYNEGTIPPRDRTALAIGVAIAVLLIGTLVATRPDIRPIMERLRPAIDDWFHTGQLGLGQGSAPA